MLVERTPSFLDFNTCYSEGVPSRKVPIPILVAVVVFGITVLIAGCGIFFINRIVSMQADATVALPQRRAQPEAPQHVAFINDRGEISYEQEKISRDEFMARLKAKPPERLRVKAHSDLSYQTLRPMLEEIGRLGLTNVIFSVYSEESQ